MTQTRETPRPGGQGPDQGGISPKEDYREGDRDTTTSIAHPELSAHHHRELIEQSAVAADVIAERGYRTIARPSPNDGIRTRRELDGLGIPTWATKEDRFFPGLLIPMYSATGERVSVQFKPYTAVPDPRKPGKHRKYASPKGQVNRLDVHPRNHKAIVDPGQDLWITEGVKKADALTSQGRCVVALTGVFNWRSRLGTLGDWEDVLIKGRNVVLCFDADANDNPNVLRAMVRLGRWAKAKGARAVIYLITPAEVHGQAVKGADDYLAAGGTLAELMNAATTTEPKPDSTGDTFTDARMAETFADDVLAARYLWCAGIGWLGWDGQRWAEVSDKAVTEDARCYVLDRHARAADDMRAGKVSADVVDGWRGFLSGGRIGAALKLAAGIVERTVDQLDAHPDLLNTPGGVVDLPSGHTRPHDPDLLLTKITFGAYRPGYTHPDWQQALTALDEPERVWLQCRIGQAITGHPTPDGIMPVLQGSGENGKSALTTDGPVIALGDYADMASPKLVSVDKPGRSEHSTERADLRGQRLLIGEELTEGRSLDVTALKRIQDVGVIKARKVHKDNLTFTASHSLMVTTNYVPVVSETDHGTWRRLALLTFPYTFRRNPGDVAQPSDRPGDGGLKPRIRAGEDGQHDAIVTWAVEGARGWYGYPDAAMSPTATVDADTLAWRADADRILGFWRDHLVAEPTACVLATELLDAFNATLAEDGHHAWSRETFTPRFKQHAETTRNGVESRKPRDLSNVSRWLGRVGIMPQRPLPTRPWVWQGVRFRTDADQEKCE